MAVGHLVTGKPAAMALFDMATRSERDLAINKSIHGCGDETTEHRVVPFVHVRGVDGGEYLTGRFLGLNDAGDVELIRHVLVRKCRIADRHD